MALYLGSSGKLKVTVDKVTQILNITITNPIKDGIRLLSSDNLVLRDSNGVLLLAKESE